MDNVEDEAVCKEVLYDIFSLGGEGEPLSDGLELFRREGITNPEKGFYASEYPYNPLGITGSKWKSAIFQIERFKIWSERKPLNKLIIINYLAEDICRRYLNTMPDDFNEYYHYVKDMIAVGLVCGSEVVVGLGWNNASDHPEHQLKGIFRELHRMGVIVFMGGCRGDDGMARTRAYIIHPSIERELQVRLNCYLSGEATMEDVVSRRIELPSFMRGHRYIDVN